ncbi:hypothetical protein DDQ68_03730 [Hymenobacter nivis]|uniref:Transposase DDE domain-containing protein n=1 Tax=Hymenobacter nivis TaxID=1850093 RepID=A0A2Z3GTG4_9BACT|nr:hypothetical protein DDQ68_03730 [Hymenobacter nivis]
MADSSLLPSQQLVDTAYVSAELLVQRQAIHQVELVGPARKDQKWQALARQGYAEADFHVDWDAPQATCPQGHPSQSWIHTLEKGQPRVFSKFSCKHCGPCPVRAQCTRTKRRAIKLRADAPYHALQAARVRDSQADWPLRYNQRAGIEGTLSQGVRGFGMRRSHYMGLSRAGYTVNTPLSQAYAQHLRAEEAKLPKTRGLLDPAPVIPEIAADAGALQQAMQVADVAVLTLGRSTGEGGDRKETDDFTLTPPTEQALLKQVATAFYAQNKKVIDVINTGDVVELANWRD